jgi:hypothetical protein
MGERVSKGVRGHVHNRLAHTTREDLDEITFALSSINSFRKRVFRDNMVELCRRCLSSMFSTNPAATAHSLLLNTTVALWRQVVPALGRGRTMLSLVRPAQGTNEMFLCARPQEQERGCLLWIS